MVCLKGFASRLNGREYGFEMTKNEEKEAKELGFVVVFGASDDNIEFRGAIYNEVGCYEGGVIYLDENDILEPCEEECKHFEAAKAKCKTIKAVWDTEGYSWIYKTDISHATFDIMEDGEKYCCGIVFDIKSLKEEENV